MHGLACDIARNLIQPQKDRTTTSFHKSSLIELTAQAASGIFMRLLVPSSLAFLATLLFALKATSCSIYNNLDVSCPIENSADHYMFANYLRQTTKSLRSSSSLRSISSTSSSTFAPNMTSATTNPSTEPQREQPPSESSENKAPILALPSTSDSTDQKLDVSGQGTTVSLDHLGPIVVNQDGTMSRISNWEKMREIEKQNTMRIIGKRNKQRLDALKAAGVEAGESWCSSSRYIRNDWKLLGSSQAVWNCWLNELMEYSYYIFDNFHNLIEKHDNGPARSREVRLQAP